MADNSLATFKLDFNAIPRFAAAMKDAPMILARQIGRAFFLIGKSDIEKIRKEQLSGNGRLHVRSKGLKNSFVFKSADSRKIDNINELWLSEYTGWKAARIFQTGGVIVPRKAQMLTVITAGGRNASGKRKFTQQELKAQIASGQIRIIPTAKGAILVRGRIRKTKKGKISRGSREEIIGYLTRRTKQKKRLDFFENFERNRAAHDAILSEAVDNVFERLMGNKK